MKKRYLLLASLTFSSVGQMAGAMSHIPSNQNVLLNKHVQSLIFKTILKPRIDKIITEQLQKYHPEIKSNEIQWFVSNQWVANKDNAIGIPLSFVEGKKKDISSLHHEITHIKKKHLAKEHTFLGKSFFARFSYNDLCKKHEWEADEGIPNNPKFLEEQMSDFKQLSTSPTLKEARAIWNTEKTKSHFVEKDPRHPSFAERANRFKERYDRLRLGYSLTDADERQRLEMPPIIISQRPRHIILKKFGPGEHEDYYADVATDMLPLFKPTNLARYSFSRDKEFLKPRVVRAIE